VAFSLIFTEALSLSLPNFPSAILNASHALLPYLYTLTSIPLRYRGKGNGGTVSIGLGEDRLTFACTPASIESKAPPKRITARRSTPTRRAIRDTVE